MGPVKSRFNVKCKDLGFSLPTVLLSKNKNPADLWLQNEGIRDWGFYLDLLRSFVFCGPVKQDCSAWQGGHEF